MGNLLLFVMQHTVSINGQSVATSHPFLGQDSTPPIQRAA